MHRPAYLDYIGVKRFGPGGQVIGEHRFLGLYTHTAYKDSALEVPRVRGIIHTRKTDHLGKGSVGSPFGRETAQTHEKHGYRARDRQARLLEPILP